MSGTARVGFARGDMSPGRPHHQDDMQRRQVHEMLDEVFRQGGNGHYIMVVGRRVCEPVVDNAEEEDPNAA
jgi:hypothetical protein